MRVPLENTGVFISSGLVSSRFDSGRIRRGIRGKGTDLRAARAQANRVA